MVLITAFILSEIHQPVRYTDPYTICYLLYSSNKDGIHTSVLHIITEEQGKKGGINKLMLVKLSATLKNHDPLENKINSKLIFQLYIYLQSNNTYEIYQNQILKLNYFCKISWF
jgi:hypothetical protein